MIRGRLGVKGLETEILLASVPIVFVSKVKII